MFKTEAIDFGTVLDHLSERTGRQALVLITGPLNESATVLRVAGTLGSLQTVTEGQPDGEHLATASFPVGDALVSMYAAEVQSAVRLPDLDWIVVQLEHARIEFRIF